MKKRLILLSLIITGFISWQSTHASPGYDLKEFVCEADKTMSCFSISNTGNDLEDMQKDLEVCNCLEDKFKLKIKSSLTPAEIKERDQKIYEGKLLASLLDLAKNIEKKTEPYLLESLLINPENPTQVVQQVFDTLRTEELAKWVRDDLEKFRSKVSPQFFQGILAQVDGYTKAEAGNLVKKIQESKEKVKERGFCLSYEGFLSAKMIPESQLFWEDLGSGKAFNPYEWNAFSLQSEINMGKNVELNKAKLEFLEMNPTLKAVFKGDNLKLQQTLYDGLKQILISDTSCVRKKDCQGRFLSSGANLPNLLKEFYEKEKVRAEISAHLFLDLREESSILNEVDDRSPNLAAIRLASDNKTASYRQCGGGIDPQKTGECADVLQNYCTDLRTSGDSILQIKDGELVNKNRFRLDDNIFSPADQNKEYYEKNDLACNKMKRVDKNTKKEMTYKDFKAIECQKQNCSNKTDVELFTKFVNNSKSLDDGFIFDTQKNQERVITGIANASSVKIDDYILSMASKNNSVLREQNKSSENLSINDVISNIEKTKTNSAPAAETSTIASNVNEGHLSSPEFLAEGDSSEGSFPGQDLSLQNLGTFGNQTYLNAPNQFLAKVEEESSSKETETIKESHSISSAAESSIKESGEGKDITLEERIKGLEKLLAEKDSSTKSYQKMITQLLEQKNSAQSTQVAKSISSPETTDLPTEKRVLQNKNTIQNAPKISREQQNSHASEAAERGSAAQENFGSRDNGRAPASLGSSSTGQSFATANKRVNNALLTKYGIVVKDSPSGATSNVSVAEEADGSKFSGVKSIAEAADVPLQVSVRDFEQIKTNNLGALEALYTKELKGINDQVVKVLVSTNSRDEVLEFYAIKESGRVVFQPIRKNKLSDLQNVLHR